MKNLNIILITLSAFLIQLTLNAQDIIQKKDGTQIQAKIIEVGNIEIKYRFYGEPADSPVLSISKDELKSISIGGKKENTIVFKEEQAPPPTPHDIIQKKDGSKIKVKIIEIGKTEIRYRFFDAPADSPILTISKIDLASITIGGKKENTIVFKDDPMSTSNRMIVDRTKVFKFNAYAPIDGFLEFSQEWMQRPGFNWEVGIGIIGAGYYNKTDDFGFPAIHQLSGSFIKGGAKFLIGNSSDVEIEGSNYKYAHPLKGRYIKVEGIANGFTRTTTYAPNYNFGYGTSTNSKEQIKIQYSSFGLNFVYGRQFILGNTITVDYYMGLGYVFEDKKVLVKPDSYDGKTYDTRLNRYSHYSFGENTPLVGSFGVTIGYIYKEWPWESKSKRKQRNIQPSRHSMMENN